MFFRKKPAAKPAQAGDGALRGVTLIDVRSREEFAQGHAEGARNIPVQELAQRLDEIDRAAPVAVYCRSGRRSATAAQLLSASGFGPVTDLGGWGSGLAFC